MKRFNVCLLVFGFGLTLASPMAQAQGQGRRVARPDAPTQSFQDELSRAQAKLGPVEVAVEAIAVSRQATTSETAAIDQSMRQYAVSLKSLYDRATREAELAGRTQGKQGNVGNFLLFERVVPEEEKRVRKLEARLQALSGLADRGEVRLLSSAAEPTEHFSLLNLFIGAYESTVACFGGGWESWQLMPRAEATIAAPCVSPCANKNWGACAACIATKTPAAITAWNQFNSCWNNATGNWVKKAWKRAQCLVVFVHKLA